jgi:hypothetical protein
MTTPMQYVYALHSLKIASELELPELASTGLGSAPPDVVQNIISSLFNSHIFDFEEGWIYVLGVGVAGGMALREKQARSR